MNAEQLIIAAHNRGMTQEQIASVTGTSQPTISRYLSGHGSDQKGFEHRITYRLRHHLQCVDFAGHHYFLRAVA